VTSLRKAALRWAQAGFPVFPCRPQDKSPLVRGGFHGATVDEAQIAAWWTRWEDAMIGVPTGQASGFVVVDIDTKSGRRGPEWLAENSGRLPATRTHRTRSGGRHLLFSAPEGVRIRCSASALGEGVDVRGDGGYAIVPPSPGYAVIDRAEAAEMPAWLVELTRAPEKQARPLEPTRAPEKRARPLGLGIELAQPAYGDDAPGTPYGLRALAGECDAVRNAHHGQKHVTLNRAAYAVGGLVPRHLDRDFAFAELDAALRAMHAVRPCEDYAAAERTLHGSFEDGMRDPRMVPELEVRRAAEEARLAQARRRRPPTAGSLRAIARKVARSDETELDRLLPWAARRGAEAVRLGLCRPGDLVELLALAAKEAGLGREEAKAAAYAAVRRAVA
jgi:bifunctional DNA primase/polymerase-like protein